MLTTTLTSRAMPTSTARAAARTPFRAQTFGQGLVSLIGASGLALLVPLVILAVGIPVALAVRGLLEAARWFLAIFG